MIQIGSHAWSPVGEHTITGCKLQLGNSIERTLQLAAKLSVRAQQQNAHGER
ncbi:hypothetical protein FHY19_001252 [Xanthomonas arboricola]|nr:hypothetical protein [Xanthomonas sp. 4461]